MTAPLPAAERDTRSPDGLSLIARAPVVAGLTALAVVAVMATVAGASAALLRPLWLDEVVTQLVAHAPRGILHALRSGVDFQPPPHYVLVRMSGLFTGAGTALAARLPSVLAAALTVLMLGAALRTRLSFAAALAGALALAAHPLFLAQAVEARPYALWIFATLLTAVCLRTNRRGRDWMVAGAAMALCATHYFGVLSLAALSLGVAVHARFARQASWAGITRALAPLAAGGVALLALLPLARAQLVATAGRSWLSAATMGDIAYFLGFLWGWRPALGLLAAGALMLVARRVPPIAARLPRADGVPIDVTLAALLATAAVPLLVVLVTLTYKPVLVLRYSAPALLAVGTLCALAVETLPRPARWIAVLLLARAAMFSLQSTAIAARDESAFFNGEMRAVRALAARGIPTISPFRHDAYRASLPAGGAPAVAWMDLPDSLLERAASSGSAPLARNLLRVERDFGRAVQREFGFPVVSSAVEARTRPSVALLRDASLAGADSLWLPGRVPCPLSSRLVVFSQPAAALPCGELRSALQGAVERR